ERNRSVAVRSEIPVMIEMQIAAYAARPVARAITQKRTCGSASTVAKSGGLRGSVLPAKGESPAGVGRRGGYRGPWSVRGGAPPSPQARAGWLPAVPPLAD